MPRTLLAAFGVGLVAALAALGMRASIEASSRDVEVVLDGPDWEALAVREGADPLACFAQAREHGAAAVAVYEQTLKRLAEKGEAAYMSGGQLVSHSRLGPLAAPFRDLVAGGGARPGVLYIAAPPELLGVLQTRFGEGLGAGPGRRTHGVAW